MNKAGLRAWLAFAMIAVFSMASADVLTMPKSEEAAPAPAPAETAPAGDQAVPAPTEPAAENPAMPAPEPSTAAAPAPADSGSKTVPGRGMTMKQVQARFGDPKEKIPAVGNPPIARWDYGWYTVYFERNYVIDSVIHH